MAARTPPELQQDLDTTATLDNILRACLVLVEVDIPLVALTDGVHSRKFQGAGKHEHY